MPMVQPKPSLKRQQRDRTRRRLLDVALGLFESRGYAATSVEEICEGTGLSKGAFYFHFPGKEALLLEALEGLRTAGFEDSGFGGGTDMASGRPRLADTRERGGGRKAGVSAVLELELWAQALRQRQVCRYLRRRRERAAAVLLRRLRRERIAEAPAAAEALTRGVVALRDGLLLQSLLFPADVKRVQLSTIIAALGRLAVGGGPFSPSLGAASEKRSA